MGRRGCTLPARDTEGLASMHRKTSSKCADCGTTYPPRPHATRCVPCQHEHRRTRQHPDETRQCVLCGRDYRPTYAAQTHCSKSCARKKYKLHIIKVKPKRRPTLSARASGQQCDQCGAYLSHDGYRLGKPRTACVEPCIHIKPAHAPRLLVAGWCGECDKPFVADTYHGLQHRYCSTRCAKRNRRRRDKKARSKRIRSNATRETVDLAAVAKRDGWKCHICTRKVTRETWSLDHLLPLSAGGSHTYQNVALAHRTCNSQARGTRSSTTQAHMNSLPPGWGFVLLMPPPISTSPRTREKSRVLMRNPLVACGLVWLVCGVLCWLLVCARVGVRVIESPLMGVWCC